MSERPAAEKEPAQLPETSAEGTPAPSAPASGGAFSMRALVVGAVTFVAVLGVFLAIYVMAVKPSGPAVVEPEPETQTPEQIAQAGGFDLVQLLQDYQFTTTLPPAGNRSVTYEYTITVKVPKTRRQELDDLIGPDKKNMMPAIKEAIRKIIGREDYLKLRSEQLDDVKRHIKQELNAMMKNEVIEDVIFDKWNVMS